VLSGLFRCFTLLALSALTVYHLTAHQQWPPGGLQAGGYDGRGVSWLLRLSVSEYPLHGPAAAPSLQGLSVDCEQATISLHGQANRRTVEPCTVCTHSNALKGRCIANVVLTARMMRQGMGPGLGFLCAMA
jgi:hypothetical protein